MLSLMLSFTLSCMLSCMLSYTLSYTWSYTVSYILSCMFSNNWLPVLLYIFTLVCEKHSQKVSNFIWQNFVPFTLKKCENAHPKVTLSTWYWISQHWKATKIQKLAKKDCDLSRTLSYMLSYILSVILFVILYVISLFFYLIYVLIY